MILPVSSLFGKLQINIKKLQNPGTVAQRYYNVGLVKS